MKMPKIKYQERAPSARFADCVISVWEFAVVAEDASPIIHEGFSDGTISLLYHRNLPKNFFDIYVTGIGLKPVDVMVYSNDLFWEIRFSPSYSKIFLQKNPADFQTIPMRFISHLANKYEFLMNELNACLEFFEATNVLEDFFNDFQKNFPKPDKKIVKAVDFVEANQGVVSVAEVAAEINLSPRQFERKFRETSGLTPKQYLRARRMRATTVDMMNNNQRNWANRAAEFGYADQSHLNKEFLAMTGNAPKVFAEKTRRINHHEFKK